MNILNKINGAIIGSIALMISISSYAIPNSNVIMACKLTNNKVIGVWIEHGGINYGYGDSNAQMGEQEMQMISNENDTYTYQEQGNASISRYIRFTKGEYNYVVYSSLQGADYTNEGVAVFKGNKVIMNKKCKGNMNISDKVDFSNLSDWNVATDSGDTAGDILINIQ